jgi:hypothetical protein
MRKDQNEPRPMEEFWLGLDADALAVERYQAALHRERVAAIKDLAAIYDATKTETRVLLWFLEQGAHCEWVANDVEAIGGDVTVCGEGEPLTAHAVREAVKKWLRDGVLVRSQPRWDNSGKRLPSLVRLTRRTIPAAAPGEIQATMPAVSRATEAAEVAAETGRHIPAGPSRSLGPTEPSQAREHHFNGQPDPRHDQGISTSGGIRQQTPASSGGIRQQTISTDVSPRSPLTYGPSTGGIRQQTSLLRVGRSRARLLELAQTSLYVSSSNTTTTNSTDRASEGDTSAAGLEMRDDDDRDRAATAGEIERLARQVSLLAFERPPSDKTLGQLRGLAAAALLLLDVAWLLRAAHDAKVGLDGTRAHGKPSTRPLEYLIGTARNQVSPWCGVEDDDDKERAQRWWSKLLAPFQHRAAQLFAALPTALPAAIPREVRKTPETAANPQQGRPLTRLETAIAARTDRERFDLWFGGGETVMERAGDTLLVCAPNRFFRDWLRVNFRPQLAAACLEVFGTALTIEFRIAGELEPAEAAQPP